MSKFKDLINSDVPVVIFFNIENSTLSDESRVIIMEITREKGDEIRTYIIEVNKNADLADALRINNNPTVMIYKNGQMICRKSGVLDKQILLEVL